MGINFVIDKCHKKSENLQEIIIIIIILVVQILVAVGLDKVSDSAGVSAVLGEQKLSGLVGILVYALVLLFAIIAALNALALEAITVPASNMLAMILEALPAILAAVLVLAIAYMVGKILAGLVANVLAARELEQWIKEFKSRE